MTHSNVIFIASLLFAANDASALDISSSNKQQEFNVDTKIELDKFYDREIIKFEFVKKNWLLDFDANNYKFNDISDVLLLGTSIAKSDPLNSYSLNLIENESACYDVKGAATETQDLVTVIVDGEEIKVGEGLSELGFDGVGRVGKYSKFDVDLKFEAVTFKDDYCKGIIKMSIALDI
ncbi:hypothetical protein [Shewanella violacea]|uniref:Lipid/polyisoprenoid-binding YceI-like domain-containing protein n=1 Tax=Shewanella violacea (strain JCM 10179 / CIP 106290 / LMG 19151 / DSS12) TaxID=637905 RepID=D4ZAE0_SHEVD|nr:hypothetical protein [Shewanella violacea]BAJ02985.1 hypothetical protein SVI_3014 [Shewanella violacea DSS12]